jgi:regulator of nucleoside diphosphate kinase
VFAIVTSQAQADLIMANTTDSELIMSSADIARLEAILTAASQTFAAAELLKEEICRAQIVPQTSVPPDVVTMNSRVHVRDNKTGRVNEVTLVYPREANPDTGHISVLAPLGSALLGLRVGQTIDWPLPGGRMKSVTVVEICYQPEAAGDFNL